MRSITNLKSTLLYYLGLAGLVWALFHWDWSMFGISLLMHVVVITIFSAVTHRYFCHRAYQANPTLMWMLSIIPVIYTYSSPVAWARLHSAHHRFADTDQDSHIKGWFGLVTTYYRIPSVRFALASRWFYDRLHDWLHANSFVLPLLAILAWGTISLETLVYLYLIPVFTLHLVGNLHNNFSHSRTGALDRWYMEYILPLGGEWIHRQHHDAAGRARFADRWYHLDTGWLLSRLLARTQ